MQSGSFWAYREAAEIPDRDDSAPHWRMLSSRTHMRGPKPILCDTCNLQIAGGHLYRCVTALEDGKFVMIRHHVRCPDRAFAKERADLAAQFAKDQAELFPHGERRE